MALISMSAQLKLTKILNRELLNSLLLHFGKNEAIYLMQSMFRQNVLFLSNTLKSQSL